MSDWSKLTGFTFKHSKKKKNLSSLKILEILEPLQFFINYTKSTFL